MQPNFNDQFDQWKNNDEVEQVSGEAFGSPPLPEEPEKKTSFTELRHKNKVPRLKKSMVLAIITGGIFAFLIVVNVVLSKKEEQKKYFDEQRNNFAVGNEFSLGDLEKRVRQAEYEKIEIAESDGYYLKSPPPYTPLPAEKTMPMQSGGNSHSGRASGGNSGGSSDSEHLAIKSQIGKDGGYGPESRSARYNPPEPAADHTGYYMQTQDEYTRQRIDDITRLAQLANSGAAHNANNDTRYSDSGRYNPRNEQNGSDVTHVNDACLFPGTIIHAVLVSRIDTDYPGPIHARVTENVYDSMTGKNLLIPQGTILQGNYSSSSIGVSKVQIAWEAMVVNYQGVAYQVSLGGMAGVDKRGRAGIAGTLDDHYFEWLKAAGIISLFSLLNSEIAYQGGQASPQVREIMDINQGIINQLGDKLIERALDIQPTVRIANGTAVSVSVNTIVHLRPFPAIKAEQKWVRK